ncbi:MAG TPA: 50S ribosomal protein L10 [Candidatus Xenobia bacterium]
MKTATKQLTSRKVAQARKAESLDKIRSEFGKAKMAIVTDYRGDGKGLNVKDTTTLRRKLREAKAELVVVKNSLARKVVQEMGIKGLDQHFNHPTAIVFAYQDPVVATKALVDFVKENKKTAKDKDAQGLPVIKAGYLDGEVLDVQKIQVLANLPSREEIYGKLLGLLVAPTQNLLGLLNEPSRRLVTVLDQYSKKEEAAAG